MNKKWKVRRGFIKMHIAVDIKSKKILALEVTRENVHDSKKFKELIDRISNNNSSSDSSSSSSNDSNNNNTKKIDKVIADGAYYSNDNFNYLTERYRTSY